jgi:hypothetical protein
MVQILSCVQFVELHKTAKDLDTARNSEPLMKVVELWCHQCHYLVGQGMQPFLSFFHIDHVSFIVLLG